MKSESFSIYMEYNQFIWSICSESSKIIMIISSNNLIKTRTIKKKKKMNISKGKLILK